MKSKMDEKYWYIIKTNSRAEKITSEKLSQIGIENYLPIIGTLKQWKDRKKWVEEPLFKSYVFVKTTDRLRSKVFEVGGIVKYLFVCGKIAKITEKEIAHLKTICTLDDVKIVKKSFEKGDEIEIISGNLIGLQGQLLEFENEKKMKLYISVLDCFVIINLKNNQIRKIEKQ